MKGRKGESLNKKDIALFDNDPGGIKREPGNAPIIARNDSFWRGVNNRKGNSFLRFITGEKRKRDWQIFARPARQSGAES